jgi:hypothetical protein
MWIRVLLQRLYETPGDFVEHLRHTAGAVIMEACYMTSELNSIILISINRLSME